MIQMHCPNRVHSSDGHKTVDHHTLGLNTWRWGGWQAQKNGQPLSCSGPSLDVQGTAQHEIYCAAQIYACKGLSGRASAAPLMHRASQIIPRINNCLYTS